MEMAHSASKILHFKNLNNSQIIDFLASPTYHNIEETMRDRTASKSQKTEKNEIAQYDTQATRRSASAEEDNAKEGMHTFKNNLCSDLSVEEGAGLGSTLNRSFSGYLLYVSICLLASCELPILGREPHAGEKGN